VETLTEKGIKPIDIIEAVKELKKEGFFPKETSTPFYSWRLCKGEKDCKEGCKHDWKYFIEENCEDDMAYPVCQKCFLICRMKIPIDCVDIEKMYISKQSLNTLKDNE
jgi:hypothetical protein